MRKSLWIVLTILFVAVCVPAARADSYIDGTISFTVIMGNVAAPPTGTFIYDATTQSFTSFGVTWDGIAIDLSGSANAGLYFNGCGGGLGNFIQDLLDQGCPLPGPEDGQQLARQDALRFRLLSQGSAIHHARENSCGLPRRV